MKSTPPFTPLEYESRHRLIKIWDAITGEHLQTLDILAMGILPDPYRLISCSVDGSIKVWGLEQTGLTADPCRIDFGTPYQNLQLNGVKGLNRSQLDT